ncbi:hypothetical protein [Treponema sp. R6D11]
MVNKRFCFGILVMTLVFGMAVVGSAFGLDTALNGRWRANARVGEYIGDIVEYTFLAGDFEILREYGPSDIDLFLKGTYTTDDKGNISLKITHIYNTSKKEWVTNGRYDDLAFVYSISSDRLQLFEREGRKRTFTFFRQK